MLISSVLTRKIKLPRRRLHEPRVVFKHKRLSPGYHIAQTCLSTTTKPCNGHVNSDTDSSQHHYAIMLSGCFIVIKQCYAAKVRREEHEMHCLIQLEYLSFTSFVERDLVAGLQNIIRNLLPQMMASTARWGAQVGDKHGGFLHTRSRLQSFCGTSDGKTKCTTAMGCFIYHSFDGREPLLGCIEDIPRFHSEDPELRGVLDCRNMLWSSDANICNAIVDASRFNGRAGVLCCCKGDCPAPINDSPTSEETGFQPFNIVL
uniref:Uncharacterized protein n=1 Tax=Ascaris lumbricoides TaxID=6252 RepID=A0A0M3HUR3_ASCLU